MAHWRKDLTVLATFYPERGSVWQSVDLCHDENNHQYCLVTEVRAQDGNIQYVSTEFAAAFIKEFGDDETLHCRSR